MTNSHTYRWAWLHLSDIHYGHGDPRWASDQDDVVGAITNDLAHLIAGGSPSPDGIVVTGDIAFSGGVNKHDEYQRAFELIERLRDRFEIAEVLLVPGNHDVQRTTKRGARLRLIQSLREEQERVEDSLGLAEDQFELAARFANYGSFVAKVGGPVSVAPDGRWEHVVDLGTGDRVRFVGWNTALLSNDNQDEGKLQVGRTAVNSTLRTRDDQELVVLLTHHPLADLTQNEQRYIAARVYGRVDAHLHGHVHGAHNVASVLGSGEALVTITAGAVHADEDRGLLQTPHRFNLCAIRADSHGWYIRVWPRVWSQESARWIPDSEQTGGKGESFELPLRAITDNGSPVDSGLVSLSMKSRAAIGRRRTAFPTDLSVSECLEQGLVVEPIVAWSSTHTGPAAREILEASREGSLLVLGPPGSGKTVLIVAVGNELAKEGFYPLVVDIGALSSDAPLLSDVAVAIEPGSRVSNLGISSNLVILIDGIDEALAQGLSATSIGNRIAALSRISSVIATCRKDEFDRVLASQLPNDVFLRIGEIQAWRVEVEFPDYVQRLHSAGLLSNLGLVARVAADPRLHVLAKRPLYARMLALVAEDGDLPATTTELYRAYLARLASMTDADMKRVGVRSPVDALALWREVCWGLHRSVTRGRIVFRWDGMLDIARDAGVPAEVARRGLAGIVDVETLEQRASFIHYSFFEFLVAERFSSTMTAEPLDAGAAASSMDVDFPIEVRRHSARLLSDSRISTAIMIERLSIVYATAQAYPDIDRQTVCNLVAYLLCRIGGDPGSTISSLLATESDPFLRNSLWWALARAGDPIAAEGYLDELGASPTLSEMNRGYLLYYYGDILSSAGPPFLDAAPFIEWHHTRAALLEKIRSGEYFEVPRGRALVDLYTMLDLLKARGESNDSELLDVVDFHLERLRTPGSVDPALDRVTELRAGLLPAAS